MTDRLIPLGSVGEQRVIRASKQIASLVSAGTTPEDAILKTAQENKMGPEFVRLLGTLYNNSVTLQRIESSDRLEEKLADCHLVDINELIGKMDKQAVAEYRDAEQSFYKSASVDYIEQIRDQRPLVKSAATVLPETSLGNDNHMGDLDMKLVRRSEAVQDLRIAGDNFADKLAAAKDWFHDNPYPPLHLVETAFIGEMSQQQVEPYFNDLASVLGEEKRGAAIDSMRIPDMRNMPYSLVREGIRAMQSIGMCERALRTIDGGIAKIARQMFDEMPVGNRPYFKAYLTRKLGVKEGAEEAQGCPFLNRLKRLPLTYQDFLSLNHS